MPTFADFAAAFVDTYAEANNKPSEVAAKKWILNLHLTPFFGKRRLDAIAAKEVERYKAAKLREGLAPKTLHNHLACLKRLLRVAIEWEHLDHVPVIRPIKVPRPKFDFLDFEEAERLVAASSGQVRTMIILALNTRMRIGELRVRALRCEDVDLATGRLVVRRSVWRRDKIGTPKGGREREIPLNEAARRALKEHRHLRGPWVVCNEDGIMVGEMVGYRPLAAACRKAGLRTVTWHTLRHAFASHLVMRGQPLKAVQELLGHATIDMTMRYAHLSPDVRRDAVAALDQPVARPGDYRRSRDLSRCRRLIGGAEG